MNEAGLQQIRRLNAADQALYDHFSRKFEAAVDRFGRRRMAAEVGRLRAKTAFYYRYCVGDTVTANNSQIVRFVNTRKYNAVCRFLTNSELSLTAFLRAEQLKRHPGSVYGNGTAATGVASIGGSTAASSASSASVPDSSAASLASSMTTGSTSADAAAAAGESSKAAADSSGHR